MYVMSMCLEKIIKHGMRVGLVALLLLADKSHSLDLHRRQNFKNELKLKYSLLCSDKYPCKKLLLGKALPGKVKDDPSWDHGILKKTKNKQNKDVSGTLKVSQKSIDLKPYQIPSKPFFIKTGCQFLAGE